ncbi:MAG: hypothetical protein ABSG98_00185 [Anaerolineales bacterium]|jgi:hypothetical protein
MSAIPSQAVVPLFTSRGDFAAMVRYPYLYNAEGDWIGWVSEAGEVFNLERDYVGWISGDHRILRRPSSEARTRPVSPGAAPPPRKLQRPAIVPLPPLMAVYSQDVLDVLEESPCPLHTEDTGETRPDLE